MLVRYRPTSHKTSSFAKTSHTEKQSFVDRKKRDNMARTAVSTTRKVRFAEQRNTYLEYERADIQDHPDLWYTKEEKDEISRENKRRALRYQRKGFESFIRHTFANSRSEGIQENLDKHARVTAHSESINVRGLETLASSQHRMVRHAMKQRHLSTVLQLQETLRSAPVSADEVTSKLSNISLVLSREAKVFAMRMAEADQSAAVASPTSRHNAVKDAVNRNQSIEAKSRQSQKSDEEQSKRVQSRMISPAA